MNRIVVSTLFRSAPLAGASLSTIALTPWSNGIEPDRQGLSLLGSVVPDQRPGLNIEHRPFNISRICNDERLAIPVSKSLR
jgi:hypothetical protein